MADPNLQVFKCAQLQALQMIVRNNIPHCGLYDFLVLDRHWELEVDIKQLPYISNLQNSQKGEKGESLN
jgi:hypothetical protein